MGFIYNNRNVREGIMQALEQPEKEATQSVETIIQRCFGKSLKMRYGLPYYYLNKLSRLIVTRRAIDSFSHDCYYELMRQTKELCPELMFSEDWKNLCHLAVSNGLFLLGGVARKKAIESSYINAESNSATINDIKDAFKASVYII